MEHKKGKKVGLCVLWYSSKFRLFRLVQQCFKPRGWHACKDVLDMLPGPNFEDEQKLDQSGPTSTSASSSDSNKKCLVVFVGGCTFAEVSALR